MKQGMIEAVGYTNSAIDPTQLESVGRGIQTIAGRRSPYSFIAAASVPSFTKATQTLARNQSHVRQAMVACALERYRLAHGGYPESLEALVPAYISQVPPDVIRGAKLKYRRNDSNGFLLYSVGWNQQDDGGVPGKTLTEGDWVWQGGD